LGLSTALNIKWKPESIRGTVQNNSWDDAGRRYVDVIEDSIIEHKYKSNRKKLITTSEKVISGSS